MTFPLQFVSRNVSTPEIFEAVARESGEKVSRFYDRITRGRIVIECDGAHPPLYDVKLELALPGAEIVVKRGPSQDALHEIREAFAAAKRRVQDHARKRRGSVKANARQASARRGAP